MDNKTYQKSALRTNGPNYHGVAERMTGYEDQVLPDTQVLDLIHASMGLVTEAGEFQDMLKKHLYYGRELDTVNLREEIGDLLWYCAIALQALGTDFQEVMQTNIDKLKARYPEKFTEDSANNRNLKIEREILENGKD
jgi:NTP pyrophosphatase (non-canonical NTP hydrolase)